jgi:crotonobetainyl-CoA:carnitine CoA-transferase CaiB-like acyl-CoA transferase
MTDEKSSPLTGLRVVEVSLGISMIGAGLAASLPGSLMRDLGADVVRVQPARRPTLDAGVEFARVWDRGKEILEIDQESGPRSARAIADLAAEADVLFLSGSERLLEGNGLDYRALSSVNPRLVYVRVRPSYDAMGPIPDFELLVHARSGVLTQIRGHRRGPIFGDLTVAGAGAALSATAGALACLYEREATGRGGWVETSLYDGLQAILPMIIGRVEAPSPATVLLWKEQGPSESLAYRCGDGQYLQLWFGAKGAFEAFLDKMGDNPSEVGYMAELVGGGMTERSARWEAKLATRERSWWLRELADQKFRCEPVLLPGEALREEHLRQIGLSVDVEDPESGTLTVLGPVAAVEAVPTATAGRERAEVAPAPSVVSPRLLSGVRVLDLSAYLAGPVTPLVLAELGADVVKVEPITGDVHRSMEPMFAAGQRGKRALALDMKSPAAGGVLERLFRWSDVVHHNSRLGLAERLGYGEDEVRAVNPQVVYSFASGFGTAGPWASLPANDHLMQALTGVEGAQGSPGQPPTFLVWGAIDVVSGWVSACAVIAGLYARRCSGAGQSVSISLLGSGMLLKSGAFLAGETRRGGPVLDPEQTGYGAAYRIYQAGDGAWLAVVVPDAPTWERLRGVVRAEGLPDGPPALRVQPGERQPAEALLEEAFRTKGAVAWVGELAAVGVPVELVADVDRAGFISKLLDDPVGHQLGRVVTFDWGPRGRLEQPGFPLRLGPAPRPAARLSIPGLGEHTSEVLGGLGVDDDELAALAASGTILGRAHPEG